MLLNWVSFNSNHFVRAMAAILVVAHHAHGWVWLSGGMNTLMLMAGFNLALFSFGKPSKELVANTWNLMLKILVPAVFLTLVSFIYYGKFEISELLMYSNWNSWQRISIYPLWYVQTLSQMMLILSVLFLVTDYSAWVMRAPAKVALATFLVFLAVQVASMWAWDTQHLRHRIPSMFLWNFTLGWVLWAYIGRGDASTRSRIISTIAVIFGVMVVYINPKWQQFTEPRIINFIILASILIWTPPIKVPMWFKIIMDLIAKSILFIFLGHFFVFELFANVFDFGMDESAYRFESVVRFIGAMLIGAGLWVVSRSAVFAYRKTRLEMAKISAI